MSDDFIETMWAQYAIETEEHIEGIETLLVAADSNVLSADEISSLFRAFHSLKGLSRVMELGALESVTHRSEDLLGLVREGVTTLDKATVDLLLRSLDAIKGLRDIAVASRSDGEKPTALNQELEAAFRKASGGGAEPVVAAPAPVAEAEPVPAPVAVPEVVAVEAPVSPPPTEVKSGEEGTDDHSIFLRLVKNGLPVLEQLATSIAAKDDAEHILAVANDIRRPLTWMVRASSKLGYMGITRRVEDILAALPTESGAMDRDSGGRLVDGIVALLSDLRTLGETTGSDLGGESLVKVLSRTLRDSLEALFNEIDESLQAIAADRTNVDMAAMVARDFSRIHAYLSSLFPDTEFGLPLMLMDAYSRTESVRAALHDEALDFTRESVALMRSVCQSKDRRPLAQPACVAQQAQLAQRIKDYLWANDGSVDAAETSVSVDEIKAFLAKQEIPIELSELLSTENTRELMQLMQDGAHAFVILAHLESSEEIATSFLSWTAERGRIITNRTVFIDGVSWYEMLFVSKAEIGLIETELVEIDPDESLVKLRGEVGEGRKIPPLVHAATSTAVADAVPAAAVVAPSASAAVPAAVTPVTASAPMPTASPAADVSAPALAPDAALPAKPSVRSAAPPVPAVAAANVIRVPGEMLDQFMNQIGEMVLVRGQLAHVIADQRLREQAILLRRSTDGGSSEAGGSDPLQRLMDLLEEQSRRLQETDALIQGALSRLQDSVMGLRVVPVELVFKRFPRMVRDLAQAQGKHIRLELTGQEVKIDKAMVESLADPLLHMIRNSVDHGIETPEDRKLAGKPEEALIRIQAEQQGGRILIRVSDDGHGIDPERVRRKAVERGLVKEEDSLIMSRDDILKFIFRAGFSTAEVVTETSGRGVGMDVVRTNVMRLGGNIHLDSELGRGTMFTMQMPLSAAVQEVLLVKTAGQTLAMPGRYVAELVEIQQSEVQSVKGRTAIMLRGNFLPIVRLDELLGFPRTDDGHHHFVVVLSDGQRTLGVSVDEFLGRQELFTKDIHPRLSALPGVGGASILGDGRVVLILDGAAIYRLAENIGNKVELPLAA